MALPARLGSGLINTADSAAVAAVPSNQLYRIVSITLHQPTGSVAKIISIGLNGTSLTAANVRFSQTFVAGQRFAILAVSLVMNATDTLNISASAGANEATYTINGTKELVG